MQVIAALIGMASPRQIAARISSYSPLHRQAIRREEGSMNYSIEGAKYGISFGTALAIAISYTTNHSILWAIIHGFFSWLYVIYFALVK
jgi:hypothetical protein